MIFKLDTSAIKLIRPKAQAVKKITEPISRSQWIVADRIVMVALFIAVIVAAILY